MKCRKCGSELKEGDVFCEECGARVDVISPQAYKETDDDMDDVKVEPGYDGDVSAGGKNVNRWIYELNMWKNPSVFITTFKVIALACLAPALLVLVMAMVEGEGIGESLSVFVRIYGGILGVLFLLMLVAYVIVGLINGGGYSVIFEMDDQGVRHTQLQKQFKKAQALGILATLAGVAAGNPSAMGAGLMAASRQSVYSRFKNVRRVTIHKGRNAIHLTTRDMVHNQIYAESADFQGVVDHIISRCPKSVKIRYR